MRYDAARGNTARHRRGRQVSEGELATEQFVVNQLRREGIRKWLITSFDTDQLIIVLLAVITSDVCPAGENRVAVTAKHVVNGEIEYTIVNSVYTSIVRLGRRCRVSLSWCKRLHVIEERFEDYILRSHIPFLWVRLLTLDT